MNYDKEFQFVQKLLSNYSLGVHFVTADSDDVIAHPVSKCLHDSLRQMWNHEILLQLLIKEFRPNTIYQIHDVFSCNYIIFQLPGESNPPVYVYIGPYTSKMLQKEDIHARIEKLRFNPKATAQLEQFYFATPLITDETMLFCIIYTLGEYLWGSLDNFTLQAVENPFLPNVDALVTDHIVSPAKDSFLYLGIAEERYQIEIQLMQAISVGQLHKAELYLSHLLHHQHTVRITNTVRQLRNYVLALNTLFRLAAVTSSVHPHTVNQLSLHYAASVEDIKTTQEAIDRIQEMLQQYCLTVKNYSLKSYSALIQKVITLIDYDLTADLGLNALADIVHVNPSYLSALFKKESGETLTEHVNRKRIDRAIILLSSTNLQIKEIAKYCGIPDVNYFTKKFKKLTGKTPKEYRNELSTI